MVLLTVLLVATGLLAALYGVEYFILTKVMFEKPARGAWPARETDLFERISIAAGRRTLDVQILRCTRESGTASDAPVAVFFHGQGETVEMWQAAQKHLAAWGCSSLVFDYAGCGSSSPHKRLGNLGGDAKAILASLDGLFSQPSKVCLVGFSLGAWALNRALGDSRKTWDRVCFCEPFYSFRALLTGPGRLPWFLGFLVVNVLNNGRLLPKLPYRIELFHSDEDGLVSLEHSERLARESPHNTVLHRLSGFGHNAIWDDGEARYLRVVWDRPAGRRPDQPGNRK